MINSTNPYNNKLLSSFTEISIDEIENKIQQSHTVYQTWKESSFEIRSKLMMNAAKILRQNKIDFGTTISKEMGKPITQSIAEIEKCVWLCEYYAENAEKFLSPEIIKTAAHKSYVSFEPLGVILAVMPWNFPFWQVFRFAVPALMAGNTALLKHASNVMMSAENIQKTFELAGLPKNAFQNLIIKSDKVENIIKNPLIKAVTLTGSKPAGSSVASIAAKEIKKAVLELGGNNAFIVLNDADIDKAVETAINARFQNTGQSCIAAKRLLLQTEISEEFIEKYIAKIKLLKSGDPLSEDTFIGVLAREDLAKDLEKQVNESVKLGAKILVGGNREGAYYAPTLISNVTKDMPVFNQETFGPAICVLTFESVEEAIEISNDSDFGLGVSLFTSDISQAEKMASKFNEGAVFINEMVKSDPRLPFGGIKTSGYGRELSHYGIKEFVNIKTIYINK